MGSDSFTVDTPRGPARIDLDTPDGAVRCLLALGHGAGGGVGSTDLVALRDAAVPKGIQVARITQPYRLAGRRTPPATPVLDEAWLAAVTALGSDLPLVQGGRSSGARVACRTAGALGAVGVIALAFPLHPPGRPDRTRRPELVTGVPTLVLNGDKDPFGLPEPGPDLPDVTVVIRPGDKHDLRRDPAGTAALALDWLLALPAVTPVTRSRKRR